MTIDLPDSLLAPSARVLDAGGWFIPFAQATHVVDLMPYETRGGVLRLQPLPGERFSKSTWHQADFLDPAFKLPFPDKYFDYSVCGHTVEDLADPRPLLSELRRVSKAGYIETPSRISEQTVGLRDRMTQAQGHPHHHWIVESEGTKLIFAGKQASLAGPQRQHAVPLGTYESPGTRNSIPSILRFWWQDDFQWEFLSADDAARRARQLVKDINVTAPDRALDFLVRRIRRVKRRLLHPVSRDASDWWQEMLTLSRPYSTIPL